MARATRASRATARCCGALLAAALLASCGTDASAGDEDGGRLPAAPAGVTAVAGSATSVHVMWNRVTENGSRVEAYEVYRGPTKVKEVPASEHMVDVTRLKPGTAYTFRVRARSTDGRLGPESAEVRATTPAAAAADTRPPSRPEGLEARAVGSRAAKLTWKASTDDRKVVSYDIYQGSTKIHGVGGDLTEAVVTGLRPGARYSFTVRARDAADNLSPAGDPVRVTTAGAGEDDGRGTAPGDFRAAAVKAEGAWHLEISWEPPGVDGMVTEYQIHLGGRPATTLVWGGKAPGGRSVHRFFVGGGTGETYRVRIRAKLPDGTWGGFSPERTVTTGR
ncbi:fibronectin type III domain-containing protein [Streptomyces abyssomicinicus]|uniref:fibronectin type III domain-containing protein n=1 Tax=Streptomyces abyssomicinicus TaxID=574929 RepID=UPI0012500CFF|nr:fibronectin type III domain-containing protein [Streptomyces abyssomicinicus]